MHRILAFVAVTFLITASARADVVPPAPTDCPAGATGRTCHGGPYCGVYSCGTGAPACPTGLTCQPTQLCILQFTCWSKLGPTYVDSVKATCAGGAACAAGTCTTVEACVAGTAKPDGATPKVDGKAAQADGKAAQADGKTAQRDLTGAQVDVKSQQVDSTPGTSTSSSDGCSCQLGARTASAAALGLLAGAALLLGLRRRRPRR